MKQKRHFCPWECYTAAPGRGEEGGRPAQDISIPREWRGAVRCGVASGWRPKVSGWRPPESDIFWTIKFRQVGEVKIFHTLCFVIVDLISGGKLSNPAVLVFEPQTSYLSCVFMMVHLNASSFKMAPLVVGRR